MYRRRHLLPPAAQTIDILSFPLAMLPLVAPYASMAVSRLHGHLACRSTQLATVCTSALTRGAESRRTVATATLATLTLMVVLMCLALSAEMTYGEQHVFEMAPLDAVQRTLDARSVFERSIIDVPRFGQSLATFLFAFILQQSVSAAHSPPGARGARAAATRRASASRKRAGHKLNESLSVRMVSQVPTLVRGASLASQGPGSACLLPAEGSEAFGRTSPR